VFNRKPKFLSIVEAEQLRVLSEIEGLDPESKEYATRISHLTALGGVKPKKDLTPIIVALIGAGASLTGIVFVLNYERAAAVVSKSFGLVPKV